MLPTLRVDISIPTPDAARAEHAVYFETVAPDGDVPQWGSKPVLFTNGRASLDIPVAYNASPGLWKIRVRELFTGKETMAQWEVE